jgi:hypothetical protein
MACVLPHLRITDVVMHCKAAAGHGDCGMCMTNQVQNKTRTVAASVATGSALHTVMCARHACMWQLHVVFDALLTCK